MVNWLTNGGCMNGIRFADEGGSPSRAWIAAADTTAVDQPNNKVIIVDISQDSDDMNTTSGDFFLEWRADGGSWADLSATGALKWGNVSDYANGDNLQVADLNGTENCGGMGVDPNAEGIERESANEINLVSITDGEFCDNCWAVDLSGAAAGTDYEFRVSEAGGGSGIYKTFTGIFVSVVAAGKIDMVTRNEDRSAVEGSVKVVAFLSDGGTPPVPTGSPKFTGTSNGSGVLSVTGLISGEKYFLTGGKTSGGVVSDGSSEITAVVA